MIIIILLEAISQCHLFIGGCKKILKSHLLCVNNLEAQSIITASYNRTESENIKANYKEIGSENIKGS